MPDEKEYSNQITAMSAVMTFLSNGSKAVACPYCGAWGNWVHRMQDKDGTCLEYGTVVAAVFIGRCDPRTPHQCCCCTQSFAA